jgi:hypothetical protein
MTVSALAEKFFGWVGVRFEDKPLPEPEPFNALARPMRGFFAGLTEEQKRRALAYRGDENHGDPAFKRR